MTVFQAFNLLNLSPHVSKDIMVKRYHELIKNFHPDTSSDSATSNRDAKILNQAYSLLLKYFNQHSTSLHTNQSAMHKHYHQEYGGDNVNNMHDSTPSNVDNSSPELIVIPKILTNHIQTICGFICDYYTMKLANIPLRSSGSTRTFFSTLMHKYNKALTMLSVHQEDVRSIHTLFVFLNCFYDNAHLNFFLQPTQSREINRLNRAYNQSSALLDQAITVRYCDNHMPHKHSQQITNSQLNDAYEIFELLSTLSHPLIFNKPSKIKLRLMDSFVNSIHWQYEE